MSSNNEHTKLKRVLGFPASYGAAVGLVVSSTAMFSVANVGGMAGNAAFISAGIALIPIMVTAFAFGELASMLPGGGMIADYTNPALGSFWATFAILSCYVMLIACDGSTQLVMGGISLEHMTGIPQWITSLIFLVAVFLVNIFGVGLYGKVESVVTIVMMLLYVVLAVAGCIGIGENMGVATIQPQNAGLLPSGGWNAVLGTVGTAIWFFIGFEFACPMAEENKKPYKNIPYALILGLLSIYLVDVIFLHGAVKYADLSVLTTSSVPHTEAAMATLGKVGSITMSALTIAAGFTTANAYMAGLPRMLYGLARQKQIPATFGKVHPKYRVPLSGVLFTLVIMLAVGIYLTYEGGSSDTILKIINATCINWLVCYVIAMVDVLVLRKKYPDFPRLWKAPFAKIVLPIGMLGAVYAAYTLAYVLPIACVVMAITAVYIIIWNKSHHMPINQVTPLEESVKGIRDRSEYLPVWDEAVEEWLQKRNAV